MKTAVRLGPIAHLRRAKFEVLHTETRHENERGQAPSHSHTWLPYITPNGVRRRMKDSNEKYDLFLRKLFF